MKYSTYSQLMIDPPWPKKVAGARKARPGLAMSLPYSTMSLPDIWALLDSDILPLAEPAHCVWLWTIEKYLPEAEAAFLARGYRLHCRLLWDKVNGFPSAFTIPYAHEYLLWLWKGPMPKIAPEARGRFSSVIRAQSRQHSRKPDEAYQLVEAMYPNATRLDVFSREHRPGWDSWGDECGKFSGSPPILIP